MKAVSLFESGEQRYIKVINNMRTPRSCLKVEVAVLGSLSLINLMVSVDKVVVLGSLSIISLMVSGDEVAVLGSLSLIGLMVSVDAKQH